MSRLQWGILGCGRIAQKFAQDIKLTTNSELVGGASKDTSRAQAFAQDMGCQAYDSYEALLADPKIQAVYIATTHNFHHDLALASLRAGKHVLCEKPFTINATQLTEVIQVAREKSLFIMEALWMRYLPAHQDVVDKISSGDYGKVKYMRSEFCIQFPVDLDGRLYNRNLAGGSLLDLGIYPISFAEMVMGNMRPLRIDSDMRKTETGVDAQTNIRLTYPNGVTAELISALDLTELCSTAIVTDRYCLRFDHIFSKGYWKCARNEEPVLVEFPYEGGGFQFEIEHAADCIQKGLLESPIQPMQSRLDVIRAMDTVRYQHSFFYPEEG